MQEVMKYWIKDHDMTMERKKHSVLFICLGNICRSPAAEGIFKYLVEEQGLDHQFLIDSAGIGGWHIGQLPDPRMRQCGVRHGYRFESRARQFSKSDFSRFDHIIVMDAENYRDVTSMASSEEEKSKVSFMTDYCTRHKDATSVPDPYYGGPRGFDLVIELLEDACLGLLERLKE